MFGLISKKQLIKNLQEWREASERDADMSTDSEDACFHTGMADGFAYVIYELDPNAEWENS